MSAVVPYQINDPGTGDDWTDLSGLVANQLEAAFSDPQVASKQVKVKLNRSTSGHSSYVQTFHVETMMLGKERVRRSKKQSAPADDAVFYWNDHEWVPLDKYSQQTIVDAKQVGRDKISIHVDHPHTMSYTIELDGPDGPMQINSYGKKRPIRICGGVHMAIDPSYELTSDEEHDFSAVDDDDDENEELSSKFKCPISMSLMRIPVVAADGHSYELRAIQRHMLTKNTSPVTGKVLPHMHLTVNHNLRTMVRDVVRSRCYNAESGSAAAPVKKIKKKKMKCAASSFS